MLLNSWVAKELIVSVKVYQREKTARFTRVFKERNVYMMRIRVDGMDLKAWRHNMAADSDTDVEPVGNEIENEGGAADPFHGPPAPL